MQRLPRSLSRRSHRRQRGVSLFIVIIFVLLSMLLTLWSSRTSFFNEMVVGNDADYQRAFEAAQALLQDAELDIQGENADGSKCTPDANKTDVCRRAGTDTIPLDAQDVSALLAQLGAQPTLCRSGLCAKRAGRQDFWNYTATNAASITAQTGEKPLADLAKAGVGARYGQYTGAAVGSSSTPANPILSDSSASNRGGWYWIEVLPYDESSKTRGLIVNSTGSTTQQLSLNLKPNVVYRITALAYGTKLRREGNVNVPATRLVLQQTFVRQKIKD